MTVPGRFRGHKVRIRLTDREKRVFGRAVRRGWLDGGHRLGMVDHAWEVDCRNEGRPCVIVRRGRSTASVTVDLAPAGLQFDEGTARAILRLLFRLSCKAPSPAAKGRIRRQVMTPTYLYARVPSGWEQVAAKALLKVCPSKTEDQDE